MGKLRKACKEMFILSLALKLLNVVNSGSFVECDYYSIPELNVSCVLFVRGKLSEGDGSWILAFLSIVTYRKHQWVGRSLCLATAGSLFFIYILGLAKHLSLSSSQFSVCNISSFGWISQPKFRILCDHCSLTSNLLKQRF